jgi:hypothetical protein
MAVIAVYLHGRQFSRLVSRSAQTTLVTLSAIDVDFKASAHGASVIGSTGYLAWYDWVIQEDYEHGIIELDHGIK